MTMQVRDRKSNNTSKRLAFGWYGGKYSHLDFILPHIPLDATHFCDVFGGSGAVILNVDPFPVKTYNDIDSELVNFFDVLRNQGDELIEAIGLTPFSREELIRACAMEKNLSKVERARRFYIRARQTRTGLAQRSSKGRWAHCILTSRAGMSGSVSRWLGSVDGLYEIVQRLLRVQIENAQAVKIVERYDSSDTVFYLDPPYVHSSRGDTSSYGHEMTDEQHVELAELLHSIDGRAIVSGYRTPLYDQLYAEWRRVDDMARTCNSVHKPRQESLWMNF